MSGSFNPSAPGSQWGAIHHYHTEAHRARVSFLRRVSCSTRLNEKRQTMTNKGGAIQEDSWNTIIANMATATDLR